MPAVAGRDISIDAIKALASNLILFYHLALYGPMADAIYPAIQGVFHWIHEYPPMLVQSFLVVGGYLSGRSLDGRQESPARRLAVRYLRLMVPYAVALLAAIVAAALARLMIVNEDTPLAPSAIQVLAHLLLVQDIFEMPSLSLGVWYVAIDFQLHAMLLLAAWLGGRWRGALIASLAVLSVLWWNRLPDLDMWAPFFFGAYGMGYLVQQAASGPRLRVVRLAWAIVLLALVATAVDWRGRLLVATATALLLLAADRWPLRLPDRAGRLVTWLGRISYPLFLIHYPIALAVGTLTYLGWADDLIANFAALGVTWLASLAAAGLLHHMVENRAIRLQRMAGLVR